jgi:inhibitor of the pro-sigma K processing machinery
MIVFAYIFGAILLYITIWLCYKPLKGVARIILNALAGSMGIVITNFAFGWAGVNIGINAITSLTCGVLGLPGITLLIFLQRVFIS